MHSAEEINEAVGQVTGLTERTRESQRMTRRRIAQDKALMPCRMGRKFRRMAAPSWHGRRLLRSRICRGAFLLDRGGFVQPSTLPSGEYFLPQSPMPNASTSQAHTPGPWIVSTSSNAHVYDGEQHLVILSHPEESTAQIIADLETMPESRANASLIAIAPELLEVLTDVFESLETLYKEKHEIAGEYFGIPLVERMEFAIAKARP